MFKYLKYIMKIIKWKKFNNRENELQSKDLKMALRSRNVVFDIMKKLRKNGHLFCD